MDKLIPVILCGGSGTRLWPLSRKSFPKQFAPLLGDRALLEVTFERLAPLSGHQICVAAEDHRFLVAEMLELAGVAGTVILEYVPRNTAVAMGLAALQAQQQASGDVMLLFCPADHYIADGEAFIATIEKAFDAAAAGAIVTFGVTPSFPSTAYGYIEPGDQRPDGSHRVQRFIEKPDAQTAQELVAKPGMLWNAGIFLARADMLMAALARHAPDVFDACTQAMAAAAADAPIAQGDTVFVRPAGGVLEDCRAESFDYAVLEKHDAVAVFPFHGQWSDVGSWTAVAELAMPSEHGNRAVGQGVARYTSNTYIHAPHRLVVALGVQDLLIVDTPDALLVANREYAEQVKEVVEQLDCQQATTHRKVNRPWGWYDSIDQGPRFQVKRLMIKIGASLSLQLHRHRAEHWIVVQGTAEVTRGTERFLLTENQSTYIPLGEKHRLANHGRIPLEIIEVQSGSYLGEDDIERFEDNYGRQNV